MKARHYGVHYVYGISSQPSIQQVVTVDKGLVRDVCSLTEEQPFTEWMGGAIVLSDQAEARVILPAAMQEVVTKLETFKGKYAWYITAEEVASGIVRTLHRL